MPDLAEKPMELVGLMTLASVSAALHLEVQSSLLAYPELEYFHLSVSLVAVACLRLIWLLGLQINQLLQVPRYGFQAHLKAINAF